MRVLPTAINLTDILLALWPADVHFLALSHRLRSTKHAPLRLLRRRTTPREQLKVEQWYKQGHLATNAPVCGVFLEVENLQNCHDRSICKAVHLPLRCVIQGQFLEVHVDAKVSVPLKPTARAVIQFRAS